MKAILEYNLPEESAEHKLALEGDKWAIVVLEIYKELRIMLKHGHKYSSIDCAIEGIMLLLLDSLKEHNLNMDDVP